MACEFLYNEVQEVALYSPVIFRTSIPCSRGLIIHEDETGNFILRGANTGNCCNQWTHYQVTFNGNIAIPEGGDVTPIAIALTVNGEPRYVSRAISPRLLPRNTATSPARLLSRFRVAAATASALRPSPRPPIPRLRLRPSLRCRTPT